jgi:PKHD-type hydroxylase
MLTCIPDLLEFTEIKDIRSLVDGADFVDGRTTAGFRAKAVKQNEQLGRAAEGRERVDRLILEALRRHPDFQRVAIPRSLQRPLISRYRAGMAYGLHVDDALMGRGNKVRTDLSVTVFISEVTGYDGGELVIDGPYGRQEVKLPAGAAVVYPAGTLHRVAAVSRGERLVAVTWVQSYVRDAAKREILSDMDLIRRTMAKASPGSSETDLAFKTYANLLRLWSET